MGLLNGNLQLRYTFTPRPNPIRASALGANPNSITVDVIVSNPRPVPVTVSKITIQIPTGENASRAISSSPKLPSPTNMSSEWTVTTSGDTITIQPANADSGAITDPILFSLENIVINEMPGVVPITITEFYPSAPKQIDNISYALTKLEADFPVTDFYADPATLQDFGQPTTIYWRCSDEGKNYSYGLSSNDWQPRDCLDGGVCFSCQDGAAGVQTPGLNATTTFTLSVITTDSSGARVILKRLSIPVTILVPSILENSYVDQIGCDRIVSMHWIAFNATHCVLLLDGNVIDANAPTNTYLRGYRRLLPDMPGRHQLTVVAYGQSGARASHLFSDINIRTSEIFDLGGTPQAAAAVSSSIFALAVAPPANPFSQVLEFVDIISRDVQPQTIPLPSGGLVYGIAVTPDGALALVTNLHVLKDGASAEAPASFRPRLLAAQEGKHGITIIDIAQKTVLTELYVPSAIQVTITPDGRFAFVTTLMGSVSVIDITKRTIEQSILTHQMGNCGIAITPDGKLALVVNAMRNHVLVIDISTRTLEPTHIPVGEKPHSIAITPDGRHALVVGESTSGLTVIDIKARRAESQTIPIPPLDIPDIATITITHDGSLALVLSEGGIISIVDIAGRSVFSDQIRIAGSHGIAGTTDGRNLLVAGRENHTVTII